jgi:Cu-processing system permease protein
MIKILKYSFKDIFRSRWLIIYFGFFMLSGWFLLYFTNDVSKGIVSLMNIILVIIPLISIVFGTIYFYNSREFTELLLAQPIKRNQIFMGQFIGLSGSLSLSFILGVGIPFLLYGIQHSEFLDNLLMLMLMGVFLTFIFTALAFLLSILNENRIKGFGLAILIWLYMAIIYDGLLILLMVSFNEYPLEKPSLILTVTNPIDLARIMILLKLDISAMMGYTGAVFNQFFGTIKGMVISFLVLVLWIVLPAILYLRFARKKDF